MKNLFDMRIAGIPAKIHVLYFKHVDGSYNYNAESDLDYWGYTEIEYEVLDRNGRKAAWLEAKVTPEIDSDINDEILKREMEWDHAEFD